MPAPTSAQLLDTIQEKATLDGLTMAETFRTQFESIKGRHYHIPAHAKRLLQTLPYAQVTDLVVWHLFPDLSAVSFHPYGGCLWDQADQISTTWKTREDTHKA